MTTMTEVISLIEKLTGQKVPLPGNMDKLQDLDPFTYGGIGYSQFNEILLTLGYDRVTTEFFGYLFGGETTVTSSERLVEAVDKFRKDAMFLYGNIKFAFKTLSRNKDDLDKAIQEIQPIQQKVYEERHPPIHSIEPIRGEEAYYLGYIVERELDEKLEEDPGNPSLMAARNRLDEVRRIGLRNHEAYLTYDHLDVYIATSMRETHEYYLVNQFCKNLFEHKDVKNLNLRWFDPTQAYCADRIDKGLVEGLMVKRAKCTIYHIQESDTFGKDSELAATLAQGKPVIAYIPRLANYEEFIAEASQLVEHLYPEETLEQIVRKFLPKFYPDGAWTNPKVQSWLYGSEPFNLNQALVLLSEKARDMYDKRAETLSAIHPLGLQINLTTGVACGLLVVRTVADCAKLLRRIILNTMEFDVEEVHEGGKISLCLREKISKCVFRVVTGDELLTNTFWNFYLEP